MGILDSTPRVTVLGSGRWGTAMAIFLSRRDCKVTLQCHLESEYKQLSSKGRAPNLPGFDCEGKITFKLDLNEAIAGANLLVISTPVPFLRSVLKQITYLDPSTIIVTINKGIERETLQTVPEIVAEQFPKQRIAHLGGPCFPDGLLSNTTPVAETLACKDKELGIELQKLFSTKFFRVYLSSDLKGVAIMGALKNIYALVAGITDGMGMFEEVVSVIVTRGLSEMKRLCQMMNVSTDTLYGLSGLGDLVLTCYSQKSSHNKNFGRMLGQGKTVNEVLAEMGNSIAEGYFTTKAVWEISKQGNIDLPICRTAYQVLYEEKPIKEGMLELMNRPLKVED